MQNQQKKVGIIGAMDIEVQVLRAQLEPPAGESSVTETQAGGLSFSTGRLNGSDVVIVKSGIGKVNAALCAQRLVLQFGVTHIINTGIAGAMAKGLRVLDFVASTDALYHDFDVTGFGYKPAVIPQMDVSDFPADTKMVDAATMAFAELPEAAGHQLVAGRIASGDQFISSGDVKRRIKELCGPACVEMEGAAIAHACYINKVPFVIIRCMSDMADDAGEDSYSFNDDTAARLSAALVCRMLPLF
ncbi:MAG TPA: 5'-methylthioadenosine/adenosylhomocysteine nucleosidase [Treponema sp.]|nr:5'-methylthioadenosine/adenosylhomocysteine nucleosidase [Treponema sp.]